MKPPKALPLMINYALVCENDHQFESWFQSSKAFDSLAASGHLNCVVCGSAKVSKAIMAPKIRKSASKTVPVPAPPAQGSAPNVPAEAERALKAMRDKIESEADYVGDAFATQAREMHLGDKPERAIYGEANAEQAKSLIEDGVPVLPLPFAPKRKVN